MVSGGQVDWGPPNPSVCIICARTFSDVCAAPCSWPDAGALGNPTRRRRRARRHTAASLHHPKPSQGAGEPLGGVPRPSGGRGPTAGVRGAPFPFSRRSPRLKKRVCASLFALVTDARGQPPDRRRHASNRWAGPFRPIRAAARTLHWIDRRAAMTPGPYPGAPPERKQRIDTRVWCWCLLSFFARQRARVAPSSFGAAITMR